MAVRMQTEDGRGQEASCFWSAAACLPSPPSRSCQVTGVALQVPTDALLWSACPGVARRGRCTGNSGWDLSSSPVIWLRHCRCCDPCAYFPLPLRQGKWFCLWVHKQSSQGWRLPVQGAFPSFWVEVERLEMASCDQELLGAPSGQGNHPCLSLSKRRLLTFA